MAIGSIGQYPGVYERIANVTAERITCNGCRYTGYIKTWTGIEQNFPPNGGGGGLGYATNISRFLGSSSVLVKLITRDF